MRAVEVDAVNISRRVWLMWLFFLVYFCYVIVNITIIALQYHRKKIQIRYGRITSKSAELGIINKEDQRKPKPE